MLLMNDERRYGAVAKSLHWIAAALFVALFVLGWTMTELPLGAEKFERYNLHKSIGVTVLLLMACRLLWRALTPPPPLPDDMSASMRSMAKLGHAALYLIVFVQVGVGLVHSWSANFPVIVFGQFTLLEPDRAERAVKGASWRGSLLGRLDPSAFDCRTCRPGLVPSLHPQEFGPQTHASLGTS